MIGLAGRLWASLTLQGHSPQGATTQDVSKVWNDHMMEEVADAEHLLLPLVGPFRDFQIHLPHWPPIHVGFLTIDLSPTKHVVYLILAATLTAAVMIWTARSTQGTDGRTAPKGFANAIEAFVLYLRDEVVLRGIGKGGERYIPFILTLFFFILFMNLLGLIPFGAAATGNIAVTGALAIISLVAIEVIGIIEMGPKKYARTIFFDTKGLPWYMAPVMFVIMTIIETLSKLTRIFALAIRLFANIVAGHFVILALIGLIFVAGAAGGSIKYFVWPAPILMAVGVMLLEIFVAFLQAYIFTMLTSVFIGLVRHPH